MEASIADGLCFPYDVLLGILRRLRGRALARSRCVCRAWRAVIDAHGLLLPHVFPRDFPGVYTTYSGCSSDSAFFAPPASRSSCQQPHDANEPRFGRPFIWGDQAYVQQHCNGLLLLRDEQGFRDVRDVYVCNPTTRRCARLPHPPTPWPCDVEGMFLAFDPAVSRHHKVFLFPREKLPPRWQRDRVKIKPRKPWWTELFAEGKPSEKVGQQERDVNEQVDSLMPLAEAPKEKAVRMLVFSSRTGSWESQEFVPGRCAPWTTDNVETVQRDIDTEEEPTWWSAEYWRGSLYVHCHIGVLMIMRVSEGKYDTVQLPRDPPDCDERMEYYNGTLPKRSILANNERGIFYVVLNVLELHVWALSDSRDSQLGWTLAHKTDMNAQYRMIDPWGFKLTCTFEPVCTWEVVESKEELLSLLEHESSEESDEEDDETIDGEEEEDEEEDDEQGEHEDEEEENDGEDDEIVDGVEYHLEHKISEESDEEDDEIIDGEEDEEKEEEENDDEQGEDQEEEEDDDYEIIDGLPYHFEHKSCEESDKEDDEIIDGEEDEDEEEEEKEDNEQGEDNEEEEEHDSDCETREHASIEGSEHSWNSDEHNFVDLDEGDVKDQDYYVWEYGIIGFHPYKDILLLCVNEFGVAYHLDTSRMQYLGHMLPRQHIQAACMHHAFPYRPCYIDALPVRKTSR